MLEASVPKLHLVAAEVASLAVESVLVAPELVAVGSSLRAARAELPPVGSYVALIPVNTALDVAEMLTVLVDIHASA